MNGEIFLVDDNPDNLTLLVGILREAGYQVRVADRGRRALQMIRARLPELVLLDINMPDMNGYELCSDLKSDPATSAVPVLFLSANDDPLDKVKAFSVGGVDYIPKPFQAEEVIARVKNHLTIGRLRKALEERTERLEAALGELAEASLTDPLTGLRNRRFLLQRIEGESAVARLGYAPENGSPDESAPCNDLAFFLVDIDHFKEVNDTFGHAAGDAVLTEVAKRLRRVFPPLDHLVRWGGEEFLAVAHHAGTAMSEGAAERIRAGLEDEPFVLDAGVRLPITCSVGFACLPFFPSHRDVLDWQDVVRLADRGLYAAKTAGRNGWVGLWAGEGAPGPDRLDRLRTHPEDAETRGELRVSTSLNHSTVLAALGKL